MADLGAGWQAFVTKVCQDLFTQDNGAFIEVIRDGDNDDSPVIGVAHLDSARCRRTGNHETPVIYTDRKGVYHSLKAHQVTALAEFPSPIETLNGMQLCAVSRVLRAAQILRDISVYRREKISGDNPSAIHLVGGIGEARITDAMVQHKDRQARRGMTRYIVPLVVASLDPGATVSVDTIDLKSLPDGFDEDTAMRWYISDLALGFGADYQDFAPLPGSSLGTGAQSLILHQKSRGRGPAFFMAMMEYTFNYHGIMPQNVTFRYDEQDLEADVEQAELENKKSETRKNDIESGVLTAEAARQQMLDAGEMSQEVFDQLQPAEDITPEVVAEDTEPIENKAAKQELDEVSDFAMPERLALEREMLRDLTRVFAENLDRAEAVIHRKSVLRRLKGPRDLVNQALPFWSGYRTSVLEVMLPLVQKTAQSAVSFNVGLGLAVSLDQVNEQVLAFSRTYTNQWWERLSGVTHANMNKAITTWQETGLGTAGFPDLVNEIEPMFGPARAQTIATTEVTRIFDEGNRLAHKSAGIEIEEWQTAEDELVEDICRALNGDRFPIDEGPRPVTGTHINCVLPGTRVVATGVSKAYRSWYEGPVLELTTHKGHRLSLTPNHLVLTPSGWLAAEFLRPGGDVVGGSRSQWPVAPRGEDVTDGPPLIEDVFSTFPVVDRVRVTAPQFHGDGRFMHGDIDIVGADGELWCACGAAGLQPLHEAHFVCRFVPKGGLIRQGALDLLSRRCLPPPDSIMSRLSERAALLWGHIVHALDEGLRTIAGLYPVFSQAPAYQATRDSEGQRQGQFGLPASVARDNRRGIHNDSGAAERYAGRSEDAVELGLRDGEPLEQVLARCAFPIRFDKVAAITWREYAGHVYDLQTDASLYQAAGVVVHNCRCARLPVAGDGRVIGGR